jgi:hypothetical protein
VVEKGNFIYVFGDKMGAMLMPIRQTVIKKMEA